MLAPSYEMDRTWQFKDDCLFLNTLLLTETDDGSTGSESVIGGRGGILRMATAAAAGDYHLKSTPAIAEFDPGVFDQYGNSPTDMKPLQFAARVRLTEAAVNQANIVLGVSDTVAGGFAQASGLPAASFHGACWFKQKGTSAWSFCLSNGSAQQFALGAAAFASGAWITLGFSYQADHQQRAVVLPEINGVGYTTNNRPAPLVVPAAGFVPMSLFFGVMAGSASAETLDIDYYGVEGYR